LESAEGDACLAEILQGEKPAQGEAAKHNRAGNDERGPAPSNDQEQDEREEKIELVFDGERPGMGEGGAAAEPDVLDGKKKFPERKHFRVLAPGRKQKVDGENNKVSGENAQGAPREEASEPDPLPAPDRREQLSTDQVTAEDEEKIDADPAEAIDAPRQFETEQGSVIEDNDDDGEGAKEIEARLPFAIGKARVNVRSPATAGKLRSEVRGRLVS
jgi:hypothetical protein